MEARWITRVGRIQIHGFESVMLLQHRAGPFPHTTQVAAATQLVALLRNGDWVPMSEADVAAFQIGKELMWCKGLLGTGEGFVARG